MGSDECESIWGVDLVKVIDIDEELETSGTWTGAKRARPARTKPEMTWEVWSNCNIYSNF